ncbi:MAG: redoxin domain-containing protein, partial [Mailhella sp.]|nr:redoxin domain-containing protein [Mailhella sp.]
MNFYDFTLKDWQGNDVPLKNYAGKVVMVVNTATRCGFTPQYKELEELYER